jgi:hypothetical protein
MLYIRNWYNFYLYVIAIIASSQLFFYKVVLNKIIKGDLGIDTSSYLFSLSFNESIRRMLPLTGDLGNRPP